MGIIQRQATYNAVIAYAGAALGAANTLLLFPWFLPKAQYGLVFLFISISALYAMGASLGLNLSIIRYLPQHRDQQHQHNGFMAWVARWALVGFVAVSGLYVIGRPWVQAAYIEKASIFLDYYFWLIPLAFFQLVFNLAESAASAVFRTVFSAFLREVGLRVLTTVCILAFAAGWLSFDGFVYAFVGIHAVVALVQLGELVRYGGFSLRMPSVGISPAQQRAMLEYGAFAFLSGAALLVIQHIDKLMLAAYVGPAMVAIYGIFGNMGIVVNLPARALGRITRQFVVQHWHNHDMPALQQLYARTSLLQLAIGLLLYIGVLVNAHNVAALVPPSYRPDIVAQFGIFVFLGLSFVADMTGGINNMIIAASPRFRYDIVFNLGFVLLHVALNLWLIPPYGGLGAAMAVAAAFVLMNTAKWAFIWRQFGLQPFGWSHLGVVAAGVAAYLLVSLLPLLPWWADVLLRSLCCTAVYAGLLLVLPIAPLLRAELGTALQALRPKA